MSRNYIHKIKEDRQSAPPGVIILATGQDYAINGNSRALYRIQSNETLLSRQIKLVRKKYGDSTDISVVLGNRPSEIISSNPGTCRWLLNQNHDKTDIAYSLYIALIANVSPSVLILYSDLAFDYDALPAVQDRSFLVADTRKDFKKEEVGILESDGSALNMGYSHDLKWCQIAYFTKEYIPELIKYCKISGHFKHLGHEVINHCLSEIGPVGVVKNEGIILKIDTTKDLEEATKRFYRGI